MNELRSKTKHVWRRSLPGIVLLFGMACGSLWSSVAAGPLYKQVQVKNGGTIKGTVRLKGGIPKSESFVVTKDDAVCGKRKVSQRLVVGKNKGVANTVVFLEGVPEGKRWETGHTAVLDQSDCEYKPHILIIPEGAGLEIVNSDKILHNVHSYDMEAKLSTLFNIAQPIKGQRTPVKGTLFKHPGMVLATCDAGHPWMSCYIMVADHPYYAVTDETGEFTLTDVPPGTYRLRMWHEGVAVVRTEQEGGVVKKYYFEDPYEETREVTVPAGGDVEEEFELTLR